MNIHSSCDCSQLNAQTIVKRQKKEIERLGMRSSGPFEHIRGKVVGSYEKDCRHPSVEQHLARHTVLCPDRLDAHDQQAAQPGKRKPGHHFGRETKKSKIHGGQEQRERKNEQSIRPPGTDSELKDEHAGESESEKGAYHRFRIELLTKAECAGTRKQEQCKENFEHEGFCDGHSFYIACAPSRMVQNERTLIIALLKDEPQSLRTAGLSR